MSKEKMKKPSKRQLREMADKLKSIMDSQEEMSESCIKVIKKLD